MARYVNDLTSPYDPNKGFGVIKVKPVPGGEDRTPNTSWTPDPSLGHLLYAMRKVGPKIPSDDPGKLTHI